MPIQVGNDATVNANALRAKGMLAGVQMGFQVTSELEARRRDRERDRRQDMEADRDYELKQEQVDLRGDIFQESKRQYENKEAEIALEKERRAKLAEGFRLAGIRNIEAAVRNGSMTPEKAQELTFALENMIDPEHLQGISQIAEDYRAVGMEKVGELARREKRYEMVTALLEEQFGNDPNVGSMLALDLENYVTAQPEKFGRGEWTRAGDDAYATLHENIAAAIRLKNEPTRAHAKAQAEFLGEQGLSLPGGGGRGSNPNTGSGETVVDDPGKGSGGVTNVDMDFAETVVAKNGTWVEDIRKKMKEDYKPDEREDFVLEQVRQQAKSAGWTRQQVLAITDRILKYGFVPSDETNELAAEGLKTESVSDRVEQRAKTARKKRGAVVDEPRIPLRDQ